jgi:hypothetical protein
MSKLPSLRAPEHRAFIGEEFGAGVDGIDPQTLSYVQIMGNPKLAVLARRVWEELREQFAQPDDAASMASESPEAEEYRIKLEGWADMLEILLEETLAELEAINAQRPGLREKF